MHATERYPSSSTDRRDSVRRLRWVLATLTTVPFSNAMAQIALGPQVVPGGSSDVTPSLDSAFRYASAYMGAVGPAVWSQLPRIHKRSAVLTWALSAIFLGGLARVRSWQERGRPHPILIAATAIEIVASPILLAWHRRIASR